MRIDRVVVYPCDLSESVKLPNGLCYPDKKEIIYRVDIRDHIKYEIDCIMVDDGYLELMQNKIIKDKRFYDFGMLGLINYEFIYSYKDVGFFMMIDKYTFCYSLDRHYEYINGVISYSDWVIKGILE